MTKRHTRPHAARCPWCRREMTVRRDHDGRWWHYPSHQGVRVYCPASKIRERS